ncbi:MAG: sigma-54-dependent transcriptional regulator [Deltaproteobacteria bacterium]
MGTSGKPARILVVDDQKNMRASTSLMLAHEGYSVDVAGDGETALAMLAGEGFDLVLTDLKMEPVDGFELLRRAMRDSPGIQVVVMTAYGTIDSAVEAMRLGAADYVAKPFKQEELTIRLARALERRQLLREVGMWAGDFGERFGAHAIVGRSHPMRELLTKVNRVAAGHATVLVTGESGTGKELVARAIHAASPRSQKPFVAVNCAAITETLLESELFGHAKGSFTGAIKARRGLFEEADLGTLFIDEVAETSQSFQAKLLRALQEGEIRRVGENESLKVDVRVIAATNRDLRKEIAERRFREDLFYRLNVVPLQVPPLRERKEDIPLLAHHFVERYNGRTGAHRVLTELAVARLVGHDFPGNVRELENAVEQAAVLADRDHLTAEDFPLDAPEVQPPEPGEKRAEGRSLAQIIDDAERDAIEAAIERLEFNLAAVSRELRIHPATLWRKMKRLGMSSAEFRRNRTAS